LSVEDKHAFVTAVVAQHGHRLRRFLAARLRNPAVEMPDLVQEVYLRLLRVSHYDTIRTPEAYLFTIAHHVLYEHRLNQAAIPDSLEMTDVLAEMESYVEEDLTARVEMLQRREHVDRALSELSPRAHVAFILHRRYGFSLEEIALKLGVSRPMVKKYLTKAVMHCRQRLDELQ
jgi:RNA polymerase sigma factor (sigma-70 family)